MSRLLSFLKKKDREDEDCPESPPPSPRAKTDSEHKSVKQLKKRKREKRKRAEGSNPEMGICSPCILDANGNSMNGKSIARKSDAGASNAGVTSHSTEGEGDSLRDVDSICEDEAQNTKSKIENKENGQLNLSISSNGKQSINSDVANNKVSSGGFLVDDLMDEAFNDLEINDRPADFTNSKDESSNKILRNGSADIVSEKNGINADINEVEGEVSSTSNVRSISAATVGTVYSSCDPDSEYFDSCPEEEYITADRDVPARSNCLQDDCLCRVPSLVVDKCETINSDGEFAEHSIPKLELCIEQKSDTRTSVIEEDVVEASNSMVNNDETDQAICEDVQYSGESCTATNLKETECATSENTEVVYSGSVLNTLTNDLTTTLLQNSSQSNPDKLFHSNDNLAGDVADMPGSVAESSSGIIDPSPLSGPSIISVEPRPSSQLLENVNPSPICDESLDVDDVIVNADSFEISSKHNITKSPPNENITLDCDKGDVPASTSCDDGSRVNLEYEGDLNTGASLSQDPSKDLDRDASIGGAALTVDRESVCSPDLSSALDRLSVSSSSSRKTSRSLEQQLSVEEELIKQEGVQRRREVSESG